LGVWPKMEDTKVVDVKELIKKFTLRRESSGNLLASRTVSPQNAASEVVSGERYPNFFFIPHKAFRVMFFEVFEKIGSVNPTDDEDMLDMQKLLNKAVFIYGHHNGSESGYFADFLKSKDPVLVNRWGEDHGEHSRTLESFKQRAAQLISVQDHKQREKDLATLYVDFGDYVSADLAHMSFEERTVMKAYWNNFTDAELASIEQDFLKTMDPEFLQAALPFVLRAHNISGRIGLLKMLQATGTPPEHIQGIVGLVSQYVKPFELQQIKAALSLDH